MRLRIKEWMELRNVSQAQISAGLGVSRATVSAWVEGRVGKGDRRVMVFPDADGFEALCLFFECTPSDLLELQRRKTSTGLVWRDFRDTKRGPGRPPSAAAATRARAVDDRGESFPDESFDQVDDDDRRDDEEDDLEEVLLFPEMAPPAPVVAAAAERWVKEAPRSSDELLGTFGNMPLASLREWLTVQLSQIDGQMRKAAKSGAATPELVARAREHKGLRDAYMKALNKLDHYAQRD